jgi:hypothetical protein
MSASGNEVAAGTAQQLNTLARTVKTAAERGQVSPAASEQVEHLARTASDPEYARKAALSSNEQPGGLVVPSSAGVAQNIKERAAGLRAAGQQPKVDGPEIAAEHTSDAENTSGGHSM